MKISSQELNSKKFEKIKKKENSSKVCNQETMYQDERREIL